MNASRPALVLRGNEIHVGCDAKTIELGSAHALRAGGSTYELDFASVATSDALVGAFIDEFAIPWPIVGVDAVISTASDLDWLPGTRTFWTTVSNIEDVPYDVLDGVVVALCNIIDRMRTGGENYTAAFRDSARTEDLLHLLARQNEDLAALEEDPWPDDTHPVPVIDHCGGYPSPVGRSYYISAFPGLTNAIHLSAADSLLDAARAAAQHDDAHLHHLHLAGVTDPGALLDRCGSALGIRRPVQTLADLVLGEDDRGSDGAGRVAFVLADGIHGVPAGLLRDLARLLVRSVDRRRRWGERATVLFGPSDRTDEFHGLLAAENRYLEDATGRTDTHPVAIIDHRVSPPRSSS